MAKGKKTHSANERLTQGNFLLPSPRQVEAAMTPARAWTAASLAEWGVKWERGPGGGGPPRGWRAELEQMFHEAGDIEGQRHNRVLDYSACRHRYLASLETPMETIMTKRKVTQITYSSYGTMDSQGDISEFDHSVVALCDDGTMWVMELYPSADRKWDKLPPIPDDPPT